VNFQIAIKWESDLNRGLYKVYKDDEEIFFKGKINNKQKA